MKVEIGWGPKKSMGSLNVGEIAFCTDTNELYIGSAVGHIKLSSPDLINEAFDIDDKGQAITSQLFLRKAMKEHFTGNLAPYITL
jgi:hypothetical protein